MHNNVSDKKLDRECHHKIRAIDSKAMDVGAVLYSKSLDSKKLKVTWFGLIMTWLSNACENDENAKTKM